MISMVSLSFAAINCSCKSRETFARNVHTEATVQYQEIPVDILAGGWQNAVGLYLNKGHMHLHLC